MLARQAWTELVVIIPPVIVPVVIILAVIVPAVIIPAFFIPALNMLPFLQVGGLKCFSNSRYATLH